MVQKKATQKKWFTLSDAQVKCVVPYVHSLCIAANLQIDMQYAMSVLHISDVRQKILQKKYKLERIEL